MGDTIIAEEIFLEMLYHCSVKLQAIYYKNEIVQKKYSDFLKYMWHPPEESLPLNENWSKAMGLAIEKLKLRIHI